MANADSLPPITLIKLGGSVITDADGPDGLDLPLMQRLATELAACDTPLLLVHGTGAVGKPAAIKHGFVETGCIPAAKDAVGRQIRDDILALNQRVVATLQAGGIQAESGDSYSTFARDRWTFQADGLAAVQAKLATGLVPVFHGDLTLQPDGTRLVFSSDVILERLAMALPLARVIMLTNVDGVLDARDQLIPSLSEATVDQVDQRASDERDVSGGMRAKLRSAFAMAARAPECLIANGATPGLLAALLRGEPARCTRILA